MRTFARQVRRYGLAVLFAITAPILVIQIAQAQDVAIKILVNDDPISDYDIAQRERFLMITAKAQPGPELKKQSTDMLIDERLQLQEGRKLGITPDEEQVNGVLLDMASKNNLDVNGLSTALARAGVNIRTLKNRIGAQMVWQRVVQQKFRREVQVNDADIDRELSEAGGGGGTGGIQQIRLALPSGADQRAVAAKIAAAENLRARFRGCGSVQSLAKGVEGATVRTLPAQQATTLGSPARILVRNAKVGQMTPPTLSHSAIELYAVCGSDASAAAGDLNARELTQRKLMNKELLAKSEKLMTELRDTAFIEYR